MNIRRLMTVLVLAGMLVGCAGPVQQSIPPNIRDLYIRPFDNNTGEPGLENLLTDEVTQQFLAEGQLNLVSSDQSDVFLTGTVTRYRRIPLIYNEQDVVQQYKVRIEISLKLIDPDSKNVLRQWDRIFRQTTYSDVIPPVETELEAQERVMRQLARDVVTATVEGWPYLKT